MLFVELTGIPVTVISKRAKWTHCEEVEGEGKEKSVVDPIIIGLIEEEGMDLHYFSLQAEAVVTRPGEGEDYAAIEEAEEASLACLASEPTETQAVCEADQVGVRREKAKETASCSSSTPPATSSSGAMASTDEGTEFSRHQEEVKTAGSNLKKQAGIQAGVVGSVKKKEAKNQGKAQLTSGA